MPSAQRQQPGRRISMRDGRLKHAGRRLEAWWWRYWRAELSLNMGAATLLIILSPLSGFTFKLYIKIRLSIRYCLKA